MPWCPFKRLQTRGYTCRADFGLAFSPSPLHLPEGAAQGPVTRAKPGNLDGYSSIAFGKRFAHGWNSRFCTSPAAHAVAGSVAHGGWVCAHVGARASPGGRPLVGADAALLLLQALLGGCHVAGLKRVLGWGLLQRQLRGTCRRPRIAQGCAQRAAATSALPDAAQRCSASPITLPFSKHSRPPCMTPACSLARQRPSQRCCHPGCRPLQPLKQRRKCPSLVLLELP